MMATFNEIYETLPGTGWLTREEAELLWRYTGIAQGTILEVGCYHGRSTVLLASHGYEVYAVDPFSGFSTEDPSGEKTHRAFLENLKERKLRNVTLFAGPIEEWEPMPVALAYLDGDHSYEGTLRQIDKALLCHPKYIAIHDVNDSGGGLEVKRAASRKLGAWKERRGRLAIWKMKKNKVLA
jgi:hypothetical protein